jgi:hypothetical protein
MRRPGRPVPTLTMTLSEAARVLGIDPALALRLAEDGQFPASVVRGDAAYRLPVRHVAMLSRVLRLPQHPAPWRTAAVTDANVAPAVSGRLAR